MSKKLAATPEKVNKALMPTTEKDKEEEEATTSEFGKGKEKGKGKKGKGKGKGKHVHKAIEVMKPRKPNWKPRPE